MAVWNIEYRGIGKQGEPGPGGWPETYKDVAAAMDYIPTLAAKSSVQLDLNKVTVAGISAGGNLSAWACARAKGQQVDVHLLDDADHMSWADMKGPQWTLARKHILEQVVIQV